MNTGNTSITRKTQIKEALFEIIITDGIGQLSTKKIAENAGISEGSIYRYFKSKDAIFKSIVDDVEHDMLEQLQKIALSSNKSQERLKKFICKHYHYLMIHRGINILLFSLASYNDNTDLLNKLSHIFNLQKKYFCKIITDGIVDGTWNKKTNPEKLSGFYMGIPTSLNIELNLHKKNTTFNKHTCMQIYKLILKILNK